MTAIPAVCVPIQIVQGARDQYGTMKQIQVAEAECYCPVDVTVVEVAAHSPHREAAEATLRTVADFVNRMLRLHGEGVITRAA